MVPGRSRCQCQVQVEYLARSQINAGGCRLAFVRVRTDGIFPWADIEEGIFPVRLGLLRAHRLCAEPDCGRRRESGGKVAV